jgi:hypothetical protein
MLDAMTRRFYALAVIAMALGCGGDVFSEGSTDAASTDSPVADAPMGDENQPQDVTVEAPADAGAHADATATADASTDAHAAPDVAALDAAPLPDLTPTAITRDQTYYYIRFCNIGTAGSDAGFNVGLVNLDTDASFESNPLYPFKVPPPTGCNMTGGLTCGLIGDPQCSAHIRVEAIVDPEGHVTESRNDNQTLVVAF